MQIPAIYCDECGAAIFNHEEYFEFNIRYPECGKKRLRMRLCIDCMEEARTTAYIDANDRSEPDECSIAKAKAERAMIDGEL